MSRETIYIDLNIGERFEVAFPDGIPANSNIDKSKTALGMTHDELLAKRHSLITECSVPIIEDKCYDMNYQHLNLYPVIKGITPEMIAGYLQDDTLYPYKKILVTPESFEKVIIAAASIGKLQWLYDSFLCFFDEAHCYAVHSFREDILKPMPYIKKFANVAMGSATPFPYTHPRYQKLQQYKIRYSEVFGTVKIINHQLPEAVLNYLLTHPELFPGNVHIFFNSTTGMGGAITTAGIDNVAVLCRNEERNMINLQDASIYFIAKPEKEKLKKFNFYSCRYNEGWNLNDDETATMILYTDVKIPHTLVGIPYTGFQAIGRLRTNTKDKRL